MILRWKLDAVYTSSSLSCTLIFRSSSGPVQVDLRWARNSFSQIDQDQFVLDDARGGPARCGKDSGRDVNQPVKSATVGIKITSELK